jgi:hypothetical protein
MRQVGAVNSFELQYDLSGKSGTIDYIAASNGYVYVAPLFCIYNVINPTTPSKVGCFIEPTAWAYGIVASDTHIYMNVGPALWIYDVQNPANPVKVGSFTYGSAAKGLAKVGDYVYGLAGNSLYVIDVSDPSSPSQVGIYDAGRKMVALAIQGNYAYVITRLLQHLDN